MRNSSHLHHRGFKVLLWALATLSACTTTSTQPTPITRQTATPLPANHNKAGLHLLLHDGRAAWPEEMWEEHLRYARQAVGPWGYVAEVVCLDDLEVTRWQYFLDLCAQLQLTPVIRLASVFVYEPQPGWSTPPRDGDNSYHTVAAQYADFIAALDWPSSPHYIIVGNEPNHGEEWGGQPDPEAYARFLIDVADALHAADPQANVLNAGLDPYTPHTGSQPFANGQYYIDAESFMDGMHAAYPDVFEHIDVWASHPYPMGAFVAGPWQQTYQVDWINDAHNPEHITAPQGLYNRGINGYKWELFKLASYGLPELPVMITETGWRHAESSTPQAADAGEWPSSATVAEYVDLALHGNGGRYAQYPERGWTPWLEDPQVIAVIFFAFDGLPSAWGHTNWLILNEDGDISGTYAPFKILEALHTKPSPILLSSPAAPHEP